MGKDSVSGTRNDMRWLNVLLQAGFHVICNVFMVCYALLDSVLYYSLPTLWKLVW